MSLLGTALGGLLILTAGGCSEGDCEALRPPLVQFDGRTYTADLAAAEVAADQIGAVVFTVVDDRAPAVASCEWDPADGDSSLPVGAEFRSINGVSQSDALTASIEGRFLRFSA